MTGEEMEKEEIAMMTDEKESPIDFRRYLTGILTGITVIAMAALAGFLFSNWSLPGKFDKLSEDFGKLSKSVNLLREDQVERTKEMVTKDDVTKAIEASIKDSKGYTDAKIGELNTPLTKILTNQDNMKEKIEEINEERKESNRAMHSLGLDVNSLLHGRKR